MLEASGIITRDSDVEQILLLDSDTMIVDLIKQNLETEGYDVATLDDADAALDLDLTAFSLIIAETGQIGRLSGLRFVTMIKQNPDTASVPVIFCTDADSEDNIIAGFNAGADDYILKPFSLREMMARVKAIIRRHNLMKRRTAAVAPAEPAPANSTNLTIGGIEIDLSNQTVIIDGQRASLSRTELQLLSILAQNPGRMFSRAEISEIIHPGKDPGSDRNIDVGISRLRKKLGTCAPMLVNKSGQGYGLIVN